MNTILIPPARDLIEEISSRLINDGRDYSANLITFPGKRPSHFLRRCLARKEKGGFIPPSIFSMDEFVDFIYDERLGLLNRKLESLDAVAILHDIHRSSPKHIGGDAFITLDSFFPMGFKIYHDIEELYIEGVEPMLVKKIEPLTEENIPAKTLERLGSLSFFYEEFYKRLKSMNFSTRAFRYRVVSEKFGETLLDNFNQIIFAGFFAFTKSEEAMIKKLPKMKNSILIFQDGKRVRERIKELDIDMETITVNSEYGMKKAELPEIHYYQSPDTHGQVFELIGVIKDRYWKAGIKSQKAIDEKTVIVLPSSETLFPLIHQTLPILEKDNYNISMGYPLNRTPIFGFFNNLMQLISSMEGKQIYLPDYLNFVLHPYVKNILFNGRSDLTRIIFHTIEEELLEKKTLSFITLSEIEDNDKTLDIISKKVSKLESDITAKDIKNHLKTIHENTIARFLSFENVGDFAGKGIDVLAYIYENSTARLHPFFYPFSESFINFIHAISTSLMNATAFENTGSYFNLFRKYLMTAHTPFEGTPLRGLQVLGFLETRNLKFDRVIILDMNEDVIPAAKKESFLLPFKARKALGLPTYIESDRIAAYYFDTLISGAKEVHLFFIENDKKEKSRFVGQLLWEKQKKDKEIKTKNYIKSAVYKVNLTNRMPASITKTDEMAKFLKDYTYSATSLDVYLRCPLQFYYRYALNLGKREEVSGEIEKSDIGKFVHKILFNFFKNKKGLMSAEDIRGEEMDEVIDSVFEEDYGRGNTGANYLLKVQTKSRLRDFLTAYQIPLIKGQEVRILALEEKIELSTGEFKIKGRLDRIEKRGEKIFILDYKTTSNQDALKIRFDKLNMGDRKSWGKGIRSLQLPFYLLLYSEGKRESVENINCMFLLLSSARISMDIELPLFNSSDEAQNYGGLIKDIIFKLLEEIIDAETPFNPSQDFKKTCPLCEYKHICGTQWL